MTTEFLNVSLPKTDAGTRWDVSVERGRISRVQSHDQAAVTSSRKDRGGALLAPSFCHPHIHIDKAYLLSHPKHAHLRIKKGGFEEAMNLTGQAKAHFEHDDLLERGQRVIDESVEAGVTHMRAFIEIDSVVKSKCFHAGLQLKGKAEREGRCRIQLCAFAQLPINSSEKDEDDHEIRSLLEEAAADGDVEAVGSTPYVESDVDRAKANIDYMIQLSIRHDKHLDFHLDYTMDKDTKPLVHYVCERLKHHKWTEHTTNKTIVLGHCTLLSLHSPEYFDSLSADLSGLPISFVGLPTSDLFMMRSTHHGSRGTLQVPSLIRDHNLQACLGVNNIGNAFTPQGSCDPLTLACNGVAIYQAGTEADAEILYECISTRARKAIGFEDNGRRENESNGDAEKVDLDLKAGGKANLVLFGTEQEEWRTRKSVSQAVYLYDGAKNRKGYLDGVHTGGTNIEC